MSAREHEDQALLREIVENIPDMIFVKEAAELRFVRCNAAAEKLLGIPRDELVGKNDYDFFPPSEAELFIQKDREALRARELIDIPAESIETRQGSRVLNTKKIPIFDEHGQPAFLLGISRDITERLRDEQERAAMQQQLRFLSARLQQALEDERLRLAQELHDELGQLLTGLKIDVSWMEERAYNPVGASLLQSEAFADRLAQMHMLLDRTIHTVRRIATDLRPRVLDDLGLVAAVRWLLDEVCKRAGMRCHNHCRLERDPAPDVAIALFRVAQEALTNIVRHAEARSAWIRLEGLPDGGLRLEVEDDGRGLEIHPERRSLGLLGMRERVTSLGGELSLLSPVPGRTTGTLLRAVVPPGHAESPG